MKHPIQKPYIDEHGTHRFTANTIVEWMLTELAKHNVTLNEIHVGCHDHSADDWDHFNQLHGYSLSGCPLNDESIFDAATSMLTEGKSEEVARAETAEALLDKFCQVLREPCSELFGIHPDDLCVKDDDDA